MIRLSTFENNSFKTVKDLSDDSFANLKTDCDVLKLSYTQFIVFKYLQLNISDYTKFINKLSNVPVKKLDMNVFTNVGIVLETNKVVLNILVSFKFFIDNAETFLKRKYQDDSNEVKDFTKLLNKHFDESFAYRFLYKLRHYAVHLGFPLSSLSFDVDMENPNPETRVGDFGLELDIELLKKEKTLFGAIVHKELLEMNEDINLKPLIRDLSLIILDIQRYIYSIQKQELQNAINDVEAFAGVYKTEKNQVKVFTNIERNDQIINFNTYDIPFDMITEFKKTYAKWN